MRKSEKKDLIEGINPIDVIVGKDGNELSSLSRAFGSAYLRLGSAWLVYYKCQAQAF